MGQVLGDNLLGEKDFPFIPHFSDDDQKALINYMIVLENYGALVIQITDYNDIRKAMISIGGLPYYDDDKIFVSEDVICEGGRLLGEKVPNQLLKGELHSFLLPTFQPDTLKL